MRTLVDLLCDHCGGSYSRRKGQATRCAHNYCSRRCAGLGRRVHRTAKEKKAEKAAYDEVYRVEKRDELKSKAAAYHIRTYTPEKARAEKAKRKAAGYSHSAYCREYYADPERKEAKRLYDQERKARQRYGDNWEAAIALEALRAEVRRQEPSAYERAKSRGYYENTAQTRRRDAGNKRH